MGWHSQPLCWWRVGFYYQDVRSATELSEEDLFRGKDSWRETAISLWEQQHPKLSIVSEVFISAR